MMWGLIATTVGAGLGDRVREMTDSFEAVGKRRHDAL